MYNILVSRGKSSVKLILCLKSEWNIRGDERSYADAIIVQIHEQLPRPLSVCLR